jgi:hypothetical protein
MTEFVAAMNVAEKDGGEFNDHLRAGWAKVDEGWQRNHDRRWARRRKMNPTPSDVHVPVPFGSTKLPKKKKPLAFEVYSVKFNENHDEVGRFAENPGGTVDRTVETKAFKDWFGDSKVVDAEGKPLVVYHGTDASIEQFDVGESGVFFSASPKVASSYASFGDGDGGNVVPVYLSLQNPLIVVDPDPGRKIGANYYDMTQGDLRAQAVAGGHDGIIVRAIRRRKDESLYIAFRPEQIKSATGNSGMFDPDDPHIGKVKKGFATLYVNRPLLNGDEVRAWAAEQGLESALPADEMHVTIAFSKKEVDWDEFEMQTDELRVEGGDREVHQFPARLTDNGATVLLFSSDDLQKRWAEFKADGASWDFPEYRPHITITYAATPEQAQAMEPYTGPLVFGPEEFAEIRQDLADAGSGGDKVEFPEEPLEKSMQSHKAGARHSRADMEMLQTVHDHAVKLGASCPGGDKVAKFDPEQALVRKLDDEQHMVWGWANIITVKGDPVLDTDHDIIEPETMEKATTEFMKDVRTHAGMHRYEWVVKGDDLLHEPVKIGTVVHSLPLSYGLAKLLGISTEVEGWIVGVYVENEVEWQKYKDGTYKAFSIGGRSEFHPLED